MGEYGMLAQMGVGAVVADGILQVIYGLVALTLFAAAAVGLIFVPVYRFVSRRLAEGTAAFRQQLDNTVQYASTLHQRLPPSVFLKPIGDEAALALVWTSAMAALGHSASSLLFLLLEWVRDHWMTIPRAARTLVAVFLTAAWSMGTALLIVTVGGGDSLAFAFRMIFRFEITLAVLFGLALICALITWATMLLMAIALVVVLLVALMAALGVGMPSLNAALYFRFCVEAIPTGSHPLVLVNVSPPSSPSTRVAPGRLSHSALYSNPDAIRAVIGALQEFEVSKSS
jgi:hypothetical protein